MHLSLHRRLSRKPSQQLQSLKSTPIPPGEIEAGEATEKSLDSTDILNRSRLVTTSTARMPYIGLRGKYNKRWYVDAITLPHNSVRALLSKLFAIVTTVQRLALDMTAADFAKLFAFAAQFDHYVRVLLEADEKVLYPLVESNLRRLRNYNPSHPLHPTARAATARQLIAHLENMAALETQTNNNVDRATALQRSVDEFASKLLEYYLTKEEILPRIIETSVRGSRERTRMERHLIKFFSQLDNELQFSVLLAAPLPKGQVRDEFVHRHFSSAKRKLFRDMEEHVDQTFFAVAKAFERAADKYEAKFSMDEFLLRYGNTEEGDEDDDLRHTLLDSSDEAEDEDRDDDVVEHDDQGDGDGVDKGDDVHNDDDVLDVRA